MLAVAAAVGGCEGPAGKAGGPAKTAKLSPEESFRLIVDTFRRRVGFVVSEGGNRSMMLGSYKVTDKLERPASESEPYKGVITVTSQSKYSMRRSPTGEDGDPDSGSDKNAAARDSDSSSKGGGENSASIAKATQPTDDTVARRPDEQVRNYDLVY